MSANTPRPTPTQPRDTTAEARSRRSPTHDYWPRDFWDAAPESGTESRPVLGDWASI